MEITLVVLAAGLGSRYGGDKQLDSIGPGGEIIMDYSIYDAINAGFTKVVLIIRTNLKEALEVHYKDRFKGKIKIEVACQDQYTEHTAPYEANRKKPWGTTHAVLSARHLINSPFLVINADDYYGQEAFGQIATAIRTMKENECLMLGYGLMNTLSDHGTVNRGICEVDKNMHLTGVKETLGIGKSGSHIFYEEEGRRYILDPQTFVSMNFWGFPAAVLSLLEERFVAFVAQHHEDPKAECFIPVEIDHLMKAGKTTVRVIPTDASWFGVTYQDDKPHVVAGINKMIAAGVYPQELK